MKKILLLLTCMLLLILTACTPVNTEVQSIAEGSTAARVAVGSSLALIEAETMNLGGSYTGLIDSPFDGIAFYGGSDYGECAVDFPTVPGEYRLTLYGASNNSNTAVVELYVDDKAKGKLYFAGSSRAKAELDFSVEEGSAGTRMIKLTAESDNGSWDVFLDSMEIILTGVPPEPPAAPVLSSVPVWESREYRNMFVEWGKTEAEVDAKIDDMVGKFFRGEDGGGWKIYQEVGSDMAYIHTVDTDDVRSEGMSYGMMICVQLDMKAEFDKLWKWTKTYMQHQTGDRQGYFAWQVGTSGNIMDQNPAPDGEEYFALALFFAANRWGNGSGIYNYEAEANEILDDMIRHKQKRELSSWNGSAENMIDDDEKQIVLSTIGSSSGYTDPSYHLPHFYELFHRMADPSLLALWEAGEEASGDIGSRNGISWLEMADVSRNLFQNAVSSTTGLAPAYSDFDGTPNASNPGVKSDKFSYDSWRVAGNITQDYLWFKKDSWQKETWVRNYLDFFYDEGVSSHGNLYELNGTQISSDHSVGLVAMNAIAATIYEDQKAWAFIEELWNITPTEGTYRYYDGCLYLFGMLNVSGRYRIYDGGTTEIDPPAAPSNLVALTISSSQIDLSWTDNADNESGFKVERSTDNNNWVEIGTSTSYASSYSDSELAAETQYYYRVRSYNSAGNSSYASSANAITDSIPQVAPEAPSYLSASAVSVSEISLSWMDNAGLEDGFKIEQSPDNSTWTEIATLTANKEAFSVTGLNEASQYYFRVRAFNSYGNSSYSSAASATTMDSSGAGLMVEAEDFTESYYNLSVQDGYVYNISYSHWLKYENLELSGSSFTFVYSKATEGGYIDVRMDGNSAANSIAKIYPESTGSWDEWVEKTVDIAEVSGHHDIFLYFHSSSNNLRLDKFSFGSGTLVDPELSDNADLASLSVSEGTLSPAFHSDTSSYSMEVENSVSSLSITATASDAAAQVNGLGYKDLAVGDNRFTIRVTAEDGETLKEYTIAVSRAEAPLSDNADLASLSVSEGTLSPAFHSDTSSYSMEVENSVSSLSITATASDAAAQVNGLGYKDLAVGDNRFTIRVTAEDGETLKEYTIAVSRAEAEDSNSDAFSIIEAESFVDSRNVTVLSDNGNNVVEFSDTQSWIAMDVDFSSQPITVILNAMAPSWGGKLSFYVDSLDGQNFSTVYLNGGGQWAENVNSCWPRPTGIHRIYIKPSQAGTRLDHLQFRK